MRSTTWSISGIYLNVSRFPNSVKKWFSPPCSLGPFSDAMIVHFIVSIQDYQHMLDKSMSLVMALLAIREPFCLWAVIRSKKQQGCDTQSHFVLQLLLASYLFWISDMLKHLAHNLRLGGRRMGSRSHTRSCLCHSLSISPCLSKLKSSIPYRAKAEWIPGILPDMSG